MIYFSLLILAVVLNRRENSYLLLTLVVGLSGMLPMYLLTDWYVWWSVVIGAEVLKILLSFKYRTYLSYPTIFLSSIMLTCHLMLIVSSNWQPHTKIIPVLELLEIVSCVIFSSSLITLVKRKIKCRLK